MTKHKALQLKDDTERLNESRKKEQEDLSANKVVSIPL